ncbi:MAG TPA: coagulation factor 5/8 type domain-containing protein [Acidobacteriaceae bacterium]|jgi:hypothetical protein|nr:coagulation factor 5/8 type domain-containing protein [Acidobacteriaceae bacterium]
MTSAWRGLLIRNLSIPTLISAVFVSATMHAAVKPGVGLGCAQPKQASLFGPHVFVFCPEMSSSVMQTAIDQVYAEQQHSEFGQGRFAFLLLPGEYKLDIPIGFYTEVMGLGALPDDVHVIGNVHVDAAFRNNNATTTFWRGAEGFSVTPTNGTLQWAVSQAVFFRRMHVEGNMVLHQNRGWASGGWMSDTQIDGNVDSGTQQQWISRNTSWKSWTGSNWNMAFVGALNTPAGNWPDPPYTKLNTVPIESEKPYLQVDRKGRYGVFVPAILRETAGTSWASGAPAGRWIPLKRFYITRPETDSAATINAALSSGKDLLLTPGTYALDEPIRIKRKDTIVLGLGFATLRPVRGTAAMTVADVDGVSISGLLFDAGEIRSPVLLQVGDAGNHRSHAPNPTTLHDVFFRVGGAGIGKTVANLVIDSNDVIVDHTWIWRADHGRGVGWASNVSANGLVVNGDDVIVYGLFVEHHQQFQVLWNGEKGRTFFYQSEIPYDPPDQQSWMSAPGVKGWASYKVSNRVKSHEAWGLGIYSVFRHPGVTLSHAIETPQSGVCFEHMITVALDNRGEISNVIDSTGGAATTQPRITPKVDIFPAGSSVCIP